jgi:hypothetical protein
MRSVTNRLTRGVELDGQLEADRHSQPREGTDGDAATYPALDAGHFGLVDPGNGRNRGLTEPTRNASPVDFLPDRGQEADGPLIGYGQRTLDCRHWAILRATAHPTLIQE